MAHGPLVIMIIILLSPSTSSLSLFELSKVLLLEVVVEVLLLSSNVFSEQHCNPA